MGEIVKKAIMVCMAAVSATLASGASDDVRYEGCVKYTPTALERSLSWNLEYQIVKATAPPDQRLEVIRRLLKAGYLRDGYAEADVRGRLDGRTNIVVSINEGQRYLCGDLVVTGSLHEVSSTALRGLLLPASGGVAGTNRSDQHAGSAFDRLAGRTNAPNDSTAMTLVGWTPERGAPFDPWAQRQLRAAVSNAFAELGHFFCDFDLRLQKRLAEGRADLVVDVKSEGPPLVIGALEVTGAVTNRPEDVIQFTGLTPGMNITRSLVAEKERSLRQSARLIAGRIVPSSPDAGGRSRVTIRIAEAPGMPPLTQDLSDVAQSCLRIGDWMEAFKTNGDDVVGSFSLSSLTGFSFSCSMIVSPVQGFQALLRDRADASGHDLAVLQALAGGELGVYFPRRHRKFIAPPSPRSVTAMFALTAKDVKAGDAWKSFECGVGVAGNAGTGTPLRTQVTVDPVVLASFAYGCNPMTRLDGNTCVIAGTNLTARFDAGSGRLRKLEGQHDDVSIEAHVERGALLRAAERIRKEGSGWTNLYDPARPIASFVSFAGPEVLQLPILSTSTLARVTSQQWRTAESALDKIFTGLGAADLDALFESSSTSTGSVLHIPPEASRLPPQLTGGILAMAASQLLVEDCRLAPAGSWAATALRALALRLCGLQRLVAKELEVLAQSPSSGPLALQLCASIGSGVDPRFARDVATLALTRLSAADFTRDIQPFLDKDAMLGELTLRAGCTVAALQDDEVDALCAFLPADCAQSFRHFATALRDESVPGIPQRMSHALGRFWDENLRASYEQGLRRLRNEINQSALGIPLPRPGVALPEGAIDLGGAYNIPLGVIFGRTPDASNCVAQLTTNIQRIAGHDFDVRGLVLTAPPGMEEGIPNGVHGIVVGRLCERLQFLHGALNGESLGTVQNVAVYEIGYEDGTVETVDVVAGRDIASVYVRAGAPPVQSPVAWECNDTRGLPVNGRIRFYVQTWVNPHPAVVIKSVCIVNRHARVMPFLIGLTAE
jgi:hypothetical protein